MWAAVIVMTPFESAVRGSLEGSRGGRCFACRTRRRRPRLPRYTTIGDSTFGGGAKRGRPAIDQFAGAALRDPGKALLFFSGPFYGYTDEAIESANAHEIALFKFDSRGRVFPQNRNARNIDRPPRGTGSAASANPPAATIATVPKPRRSVAAEVALVASWTLTALASLAFGLAAIAADQGSVESDIVVTSGLLALAFWAITFALTQSEWCAAKRPATPVPDAGGPQAEHASLSTPSGHLPQVQHFDADRRRNMVTDAGDDVWFDYDATMTAVIDALISIHAMGGGRRAAIETHDRCRVTIVPDWIAEYSGLESMAADLEQIETAERDVTRVRWKFSSRATPETVERAVDEGQAAMERANHLLGYILRN